MRQVLASAPRGPIGLIEPSDNIGDGTGILDALLRFEVENAAVILNDPEAAAACYGHSIGDRLTLPMGGKLDRFHGDTVTLEVVLENERSHLASLVGRHVDMGPSAVVGCGGIHIR